MRILVMGGSRFMGPTVIEELRHRGHEVTAFNRGTRVLPAGIGAREVHGDRNDPAQLEPLRRRTFDAVVDMSAYLRVQTDSLLTILGGVTRWVHISTGAVYEPQHILPWPETTPYGPWDLWGTYAEEKLGCELSLRERRSPELPTTCLRLPIVLGPGNYAPREEFVFNRLLDDAEILVQGDGKAVVQFVSIHEVGEAVANAVDQGPSGFAAFNIASPSFTSLEGFATLCAQIAEREPRIRRVVHQAMPFDAYDAVFPFPNENYVLDLTRSRDAGIAPTPRGLEAILREAFQFLVTHPDRRLWERTKAEKLYLPSSVG